MKKLPLLLLSVFLVSNLVAQDYQCLKANVEYTFGMKVKEYSTDRDYLLFQKGNLTAGVYFIRVTVGEKEMGTKKLIIQP